MRSMFKLLPKNPNPRGGCACSPHAKLQDCKAPFVVWHASTNDYDHRNPHVVTCLACVTRAVQKAAPADKPDAA